MSHKRFVKLSDIGLSDMGLKGGVHELRLETLIPT